MLKLEQAIEAIEELKTLATSEEFKADLQKMKALKGLTAEEKIAAVKELRPVIDPLAKLVKAFTGEKIDLLVDDVVEVLDAVFEQ
jgi:hypothetical protein